MTRKPEIRSFIVDTLLFGDDGFVDLDDDTSLLGAGIVDSTGVVELVGFIERSYDVSLESGEIVPANLDSISRIDALVARKLT